MYNSLLPGNKEFKLGNVAVFSFGNIFISTAKIQHSANRPPLNMHRCNNEAHG
jgi:hypothetical protein